MTFTEATECLHNFFNVELDARSMKHLKHHAMHLLMCGPMLLIAIIAIASGSSFAALVPVIACMLMMGMMMSAMGGHGGGGNDRS